jgi:hypothetical protein
MSAAAAASVHRREVRVDAKTKDTRIRLIEAKRGDSIAFTAVDGPITVIMPDRRLVLSNPGAVRNLIEKELWYAFDLPQGQTAEILVPELYPDFVPDPLREPEMTGTREIYYTVLCGETIDGAYPATGTSPPRIIIPPVQS